MKIAFFEVESWEKPILSSALFSHTVMFCDGVVAPETMQSVRDVEILSIFIYSRLTQEVLSQLPKLKLIATRSTGFDHIDLGYCRNKGITVCNVPTYGVDTIAEHTFALVLALSRKLIPSIEHTRRGDFSLEGLRGINLAGKTLGIVGLGHIGIRVMELAKAFKMNVLVNSRHADPLKAKVLGIAFVDLPTLLAQSDIVSLHVPLNAQTTHLINKTNIEGMKKGSFLINTARGGVVETEAILWALERGILAGAGIDVLEEECVLKEERALLTKEFLKTCDLKTQLLNHILLTKENVVVTPHNAFNSTEALQEILTVTIGNIMTYISGVPTNTVSPR